MSKRKTIILILLLFLFGLYGCSSEVNNEEKTIIPNLNSDISSESPLNDNAVGLSIKDVSALFDETKKEVMERLGPDYDDLSPMPEIELLNYWHDKTNEVVTFIPKGIHEIEDYWGSWPAQLWRYFDEPGITVIFTDDTSIDAGIDYINCSDKIDILGAHAGMSFKDIQDILGETKLHEVTFDVLDSTSYYLSYEVCSCEVIFISEDIEGKDTFVTVLCKYKK